jgi:Flp pilus assembly protein TadG
MSHRAHRRGQQGFGLLEFAVVLPFLLLVVFGMVDFSRAIQVNSTVAEAARQGARQGAPNAATGDNPFSSTVSGPCSGTVFTQNATGSGCLTDQGIFNTVKAVLRDVTTTVTLRSNTTAANCPTPAAGAANVCISPEENNSTSVPAYTDCAAAKTALGHDPAPGDLGARYQEWTNNTYRAGRCFLVQVTVKYVFQPWTPGINKIIGSSVTLTASTSTVTEY